MQEVNYTGTALVPLYPGLFRNRHKETKPVVWGSQTVGFVLLCLIPLHCGMGCAHIRHMHMITAPFAE